MLLRLSSYLLLLLLPFQALSSRKAKIIEGSLDELRGMKKLNLKFVYDGQTIGKKEIPNEEYVNNRKQELNDKQSGKGSTWALAWTGNRTRIFEPAFKNSFNKAEAGIRVATLPDEKYTLIFKSTNLEPGYNVGVSRKNALLSGEAWIVETANPDHVICKIAINDAPGSMGGFDFDNGTRMSASYMVAGNAIGKLMKKKLKGKKK